MDVKQEPIDICDENYKHEQNKQLFLGGKDDNHMINFTKYELVSIKQEDLDIDRDQKEDTQLSSTNLDNAVIHQKAETVEQFCPNEIGNNLKSFVGIKQEKDVYKGTNHSQRPFKLDINQKGKLTRKNWLQKGTFYH
ncbi:uncharacterized protein LOC130894698 isoform X3 [Diorhabda carinulata]|uniref:uncharacterized protein LOC130894698 isoform X3 n=1 Tax=Diorhabda carinulata TaxID=1163345 RepID=UPI0025A2D3EF|nr:uncharacterized protein LOC130894698 isoform X3 [Diorhabda carinulata]